MARFVEADDEDIQYFRKAATAANTTTSTNTWVRAWREWADGKGHQKQLYEYEPTELSNILSSFYVEPRKKDGKEYEPGCLTTMMTSLDRHLRENGYNLSIVKDQEFAESKKILEGRATELRRQGKGKLPNRSRSLSTSEVEVLWEHREFGKHSPQALLQTVYWFLGQHCGIRGRSEHYNLQVEDFVIEKNKNGKEYVAFYEGLTKNHTGGLYFKARKIKSRMHAIEGERNPLLFFKLYISKRPEILRKSGPLYLKPIQNPKSDIWCKTTRMGINNVPVHP